MTSFYADGPARPSSPLPPPPTIWEDMLVTSSLQGHLIELLYTNEVAGLGALSRRCKASFLAPSLLRSSIQATGPSDATRFQFWKKALHVPEVQHQLLFSRDAECDLEEDKGDRELLDKAGFEVFQSVLFSSARGCANGAGEDALKEVGGKGKDAADEESLNSFSDGWAKPEPQPQEQQQQQRYSGKRMLAQDGQEGEILRDVTRTFPKEPLFHDSAGVGQNLLANVLKACLSFHDDTGHRAPVLRCCVTSSDINRSMYPLTESPIAVSGGDKGGGGEGTAVCKSSCGGLHSSSFPSYPPPDGSGSLRSENDGYLSHHHHHHYNNHQQQQQPLDSQGPYSPSNTTDEEDGYHSDHSTQTQGSECFSPPPASFYQRQRSIPVDAAVVPSPQQQEQQHGAATNSNPTNSSSSSSSTTTIPNPEKRALAKRYGFLWECSEEHMHVASEVFWMMTAVMSSSSGLSMRLLWHPDVPHMKLRVYQFDRLLSEHLPRLHVHFKYICLAPDILVTQWHMTLLAYCLPLRVLTRVWDVVFQDGWKALFRISLALLQAVEEDLLVLNLEESGRFLRQWTSKRHPLWRNAELLLRAARRWKVTRTTLTQLQEEFALTLLKEQLKAVAAGGGDGNSGKITGLTGEWLSRYGPPGEEGGEGCCLLKGPELEGLQRDIELIEGPVARDFAHYRVKIEEASVGCELAGRRVGELEGRMTALRMQVEEMEEVCSALHNQLAGITLLQQQLQQQRERQREEKKKEGGKEKKEAEEEEGAPTMMTGGGKSLRLFNNLLSAHRKGFAGTMSPVSLSSPTSDSRPSLASSLLSSIRDIRPLQRRAGGGTVTVEEDRSSCSCSGSGGGSLHGGNPTIFVISPKTRTKSLDSWCSVASSSSSTSSSSSRQSSLDLSDMGKVLESVAPGRTASLSPGTDFVLSKNISSSSKSSSASGDRCRTSSACSSKSNSSKSRTSSVGTVLGRKKSNTSVTTPPSSFSVIVDAAGRGRGGAAVAAAAAVTQPPDDPHNKDLLVQERKISRADAQLTVLKKRYAALEREKTEAGVAFEEAEIFRASLSEQLMHLLQQAEGEVKKRMKEVVQSQPKHPHAAEPLALLPNRIVLASARKATLQAQVRRRGSSSKRVKGDEEIVLL